MSPVLSAVLSAVLSPVLSPVLSRGGRSLYAIGAYFLQALFFVRVLRDLWGCLPVGVTAGVDHTQRSSYVCPVPWSSKVGRVVSQPEGRIVS